MANVQVLYAESVAATTAATTAWVDVATIPAASFTAGKKYLILANQICKNSSSSIVWRCRLVHGTTPTEFDDALLNTEIFANSVEDEQSYMFLYTQPGTTELVKLQISSETTQTVTNIFSQIIAINMDDVGADGTDYFWNEFLTNYTMISTPTEKAITASFTPNGTDRWLYIGHMIHDVVSITDVIGFELYDSVAGVLSMTQVEGEDATNDFLGRNLFWAGVPTNAARTLAVRPKNAAGSNVMLASRVIAINPSKFAQSASAFDAAEVDPATSPTWSTVATVAPTPTNTGDWVVIAYMTVDVGSAGDVIMTRVQVNPSGGGLADDPPYTNAPPGALGQDTLDETPQNIFNLVSLSSGGARTINYDVTQTSGTGKRVEDNGLVAFSVELASGTTPINGRVFGSSSAYGNLTASGALAGQSVCQSQANGNLAGSVSLVAQAYGFNIVYGDLALNVALQGIGFGSSYAYANLSGAGALSGQLAGQSQAYADLAGSGVLAGQSVCQSQAYGNLAGNGTLESEAYGFSIGYVNLTGIADANGQVFGSSYAYANLSSAAPGALSGQLAGQSQAYADLAGSGVLAGQAYSLSIGYGDLTGFAIGPLVGQDYGFSIG